MASEHTSDYVLNPAQIKALKKAVFLKNYGYNSEDEITLTVCDLDESEIAVSDEVIVKACLAYLRNYPCKSAEQETAMCEGMEYIKEVLLDFQDEDEDYEEEEDSYTCDYSPPFPWTYKGTNYMTDKNNHVWRVHVDGGCGQWCGVYNADKDCIEDTMYNAIYATMGK
jgi:hypothetical protein